MVRPKIIAAFYNDQTKTVRQVSSKSFPFAFGRVLSNREESAKRSRFVLIAGVDRLGQDRKSAHSSAPGTSVNAIKC